MLWASFWNDMESIDAIASREQPHTPEYLKSRRPAARPITFTSRPCAPHSSPGWSEVLSSRRFAPGYCLGFSGSRRPRLVKPSTGGLSSARLTLRHQGCGQQTTGWKPRSASIAQRLHWRETRPGARVTRNTSQSKSADECFSGSFAGNMFQNNASPIDLMMEPSAKSLG